MKDTTFYKKHKFKNTLKTNETYNVIVILAIANVYCFETRTFISAAFYLPCTLLPLVKAMLRGTHVSQHSFTHAVNHNHPVL